MAAVAKWQAELVTSVAAAVAVEAAVRPTKKANPY
jgi:hypothetical protein